MKRFLAFLGVQYTTEGGMKNFIGDFDTINEAIDSIKGRIVSDPSEGDENSFFDGNDNFAHVWDSEKRAIVWDMKEKFHSIVSNN